MGGDERFWRRLLGGRASSYLRCKHLSDALRISGRCDAMGWSETLDALGCRLVSRMGPLSLELAILALLIVGALHLLRPGGASVRHRFWLLVLAKPVVALLVVSPLCIYSMGALTADYAASATSMPAVSPASLSLGVAPMGDGVAGGTRASALAAEPGLAPGQGGGGPAWPGMLALAWLVGAGLLGLRLAAGFAYLGALIRRAQREPQGRLERAMQAARQRLGLRRRVRVRVSEAVSGPLVAGILRPVVLVPPEFGRPLSDKQLQMVFAHELGHVARWDNLLLVVQRVAELALFFHPAVWLCGRYSRREADAACDERVIAAYGARADYADGLTKVAETGIGRARGAAWGTLAAAEADLPRRVRDILKGGAKPMKRRAGVMSVVVFILIAVVGLPGATLTQPAAQQAPDAVDAWQDQDVLVIEDFEGDVSARWRGGMIPETELVQEGDQAGYWKGATFPAEINNYDIPHNWTGYTHLEFWCYSGLANDAEFVLNLYTDNEATEGIDYLQRRIKVDWEGWRQFSFPLESFRWSREPTLERIERIAMSNKGWALTPAPDTVLVFDDIVLTTKAPREVAPGVIEDFEGETNIFLGTQTVEHEGHRCGKWAGFTDDPNMLGRPVEDWTDYDFLEMDIASEVANDDEFLVMVRSANPDTESYDYWSFRVPVDWVGWKHFKVPFRRLTAMREPLGWDMISGLGFFRNGWGLPNKPDTVLYLDNIRLTKGADDPLMGPGMVESFEYGIYGWQGAVIHESEHVGQGKYALRIKTSPKERTQWLDADGNPPQGPLSEGALQPDGTLVAQDAEGNRVVLTSVKRLRHLGQAWMQLPEPTDVSGKKLTLWTYVSGLQGAEGHLRIGLMSRDPEHVEDRPQWLWGVRELTRDGVLKIEVDLEQELDAGATLDPTQVAALHLRFTVTAEDSEAEAPYLCVDEIRLVE